ncbi:damage-control phosphatase ARMT1-like isoform X1 [Euwallacea similis]|uniref:damage-control phosphatase ARMT1-like isoform X1 n=2 Tax=Euwallacea similis TaxID=1736056 RepID=UPI0034508E07
MDIKTPRNVYLSAFYKRSFAYHTVKNRMPVILTQIIDSISRTKEDIVQEFGKGSHEDLKKAISELAKLKYEIQTNKPLTKLVSKDSDIKIYNEFLEKQASQEGEATHFNTIFLLSECYMYRRIKESFVLTDTLKEFDYFRSFKKELFVSCQKALKIWCDYNVELFHKSFEENWAGYEDKLHGLIKVDLWGNKNDLSLTLGRVGDMSHSHDADALEHFILVDDSKKFLKDLVEISVLHGHEYIDIVLDNAGYELLTDLCLMTAFTIFFRKQGDPCQSRFKVRFHVKSIPWYLSDVMEYDFNWMLEQIASNEDANISSVGKKWQDFIRDGTWEVMPHPFWTYPCEYNMMPDYAPDLFELLSKSAMVIFKGDLNYRKIFGEKNWDPTTSPKIALQGLELRLLAIRTIKADIVCGLQPGIAERCEKEDAKWMENGDYGVIQYVLAKQH